MHSRSFLNLPAANDFVLTVAWLLAALRPSGPYPLLAVAGEQGSAKTTLTKILRALVDPKWHLRDRCRARNAIS